MNAASNIPASIPFHLARAYGSSAPAARAGDRPTAQPTQPPASDAPVAPDTFSRSAQAPSRARGGVNNLVAAQVAGGVHFATPAQPAPYASTGALPMYRHPADKNQAATAVLLGRSVDISG